jgi:hypothetical protein
VSNKSGQNDIFAKPYPGPGSEVTISVGGGREPVWGPSGRELFYRQDRKLLVVKIDETATSLNVGAPTRVFDDPYRLDTGGSQGGMANYDISPDGKRFVFVEEPQTTNAAAQPVGRLQVVLNWLDELKRRVPTPERYRIESSFARLAFAAALISSLTFSSSRCHRRPSGGH